MDGNDKAVDGEQSNEADALLQADDGDKEEDEGYFSGEEKEQQVDGYGSFTWEAFYAKYKRTRCCFVTLFLISVLWTLFLSIAAALFRPYFEECEPSNTFSKFATCVICYILLQYIIDTCMAGINFCNMRNIIKKNVIGRMEGMTDMKKKLKMDLLVRNGDVKSEPLSRTIEMGQTVRALVTMKNFVSKSEVSARDDMSIKNLEMGLATLPQPKFKKTAVSCEFPHEDHIGYGGKIFVGISTFPVLSVFFFLVVGVDTLKDIRVHLDGKGVHTIPTVCIVSYAFNWTVLAFVVIQGFMRLIPMIRYSIVSRKNVLKNYILLKRNH